MIGVFLLLLNALVYANNTGNMEGFEQFLQTIRIEATARGVSKATLNQALIGLTPDPKVIKFDRTQAEFSQNFWHYLGLRVSAYRLKKGKQALAENTKIFQQTHKKYGVPGHILTAFWGLETNYGNHTGSMNLIRSLATLSFDPRRSKFFTEQLLTLLQLIDQGKIPIDAKGSWAGAMGHVQFMPTNVAQYAVDANQNNKLGLWSEKSDIFASAANFLQNIGWKKGERWGREVIIPADLNHQLAGLSVSKTLNEWQALGVRTAKKEDLPKSELKASLILPMGYQGPAFLVYPNFHVILRWNRSILYALSVGHLSDRLIGEGELISKPIKEPSLHRSDVKYIQQTLNKMGFDAGEPDGVSGPKTRAATRRYQHTNGLPVDGYVGYQLLQQLQ